MSTRSGRKCSMSELDVAGVNAMLVLKGE